MNRKKLPAYFTVFIIILILLIVIVTKIIDIEEPDDSDKEVQYYNSYIKNCKDNIIKVYIDNEEKEFQITAVQDDITGQLADITVKNGYVTKLLLKQNTVHGKVLSVGEGYVSIEGYGKLETTDNFKVYKSYSGLEEVTGNKILVGYDVTNFYIENDKICGAIVYKNIDADIIRVLLNTTGYASIYHEKLVLNADCDYIITYGNKTDTIKAGKKTKITSKSKYFKTGDIKIECLDDTKGILITSIERGYGNPTYEGAIYVSNTDDGLLVINELELERYLYYVVPSEMPSSYGVDALEVQAICARTYAYRQILNNAYGMYGAHVDDSVTFQVYNNSQTSDNAITAVNNTYGKIISQEDEPIEAFFFSTSCGSTTDADIWGGSGREYIKGRMVTEEDSEVDLTDNKVFDEFIKSEYESYDSEFPYYRWNVTFSNNELESIANNVSGKEIGTVKSISINSRGTGGIIKSITIKGKKDSVIIEGELNIRKALNVTGKKITLNDGTENTSFTILPSAYFTVATKDNNFNIIGGGYGHGVGMSQNAVKAMIEAGMTVEEIICFFYNNVEVQAIYS